MLSSANGVDVDAGSSAWDDKATGTNAANGESTIQETIQKEATIK